MNARWDLLVKLIDSAIKEEIFPSASACVWKRGETVFSYYAGYSQITPIRRELKAETLFDLASLTKPLACGLVMMWFVEQKRFSIDDKLESFFDVPPDKKDITVAHLLSHCAGFAAWKPYNLNWQGESGSDFFKTVLSEILAEPLEYAIGKGCAYSDLGYILLLAIVEKACETRFDEAFYRVRDMFETPSLIFIRHEHKILNIFDFAATEDCSWRNRVIVGEVHDENAWAMGGVSAHAGLFGTANDVCRLGAKLLSIFSGSKGPLKTETVKTFWNYVGAGTYKLAWDSPSLTGSSAGELFSKKSLGHTGFTGTSIWIDPARELVAVLLTNRIHPSRSNEKIREFRPVFHDMLVKILEGAL